MTEPTASALAGLLLARDAYDLAEVDATPPVREVLRRWQRAAFGGGGAEAIAAHEQQSRELADSLLAEARRGLGVTP